MMSTGKREGGKMHFEMLQTVKPDLVSSWNDLLWVQLSRQLNPDKTGLVG